MDRVDRLPARSMAWAAFRKIAWEEANASPPCQRGWRPSPAVMPRPCRGSDPRAFSQARDRVATPARSGRCAIAAAPCGRRSEEHTSELQSLMRNSYDAFCLITKKNITHDIEQECS